MRMTLKAARRKRGWNLEQLAKASGVHFSTISRLERGETKPMHDTVTALEQALGLKRGTLLFGVQAEALAS
jgi:transcriptional regulator with XRE-family HTH domain